MPSTTALLPDHGRLSCAACFDGEATWGVSSLVEDGWILEHNPMAWGSRSPEFLVLGVSKGSRQCDAIARMPHDAVAFAGFRPKMTEALRTLGLLGVDETVDEHIRRDEARWAFGSLIRCSVGLVAEDDEVEKSGGILPALAKEGTPGARWMRTCMDRHLRHLPDSLRVVVLLGNDDRFLKAVCERLGEVRPGLHKVNDVAWSDGRVTFVHVVHVGGPGKNHTRDWLGGEDGKQAGKRTQAVAAVAAALGLPVPPFVPVPAGSAPAKPAQPIQRPKRSDVAPPATGLARVVDGVLRVDPRLRPHPSSPNGTDKVRLYRAANGRVLVHEHRLARSQPLLVAAGDVDAHALADIPHDPAPVPATGRNWHYDTAPELRGRPLVKFRPETEEQVRRIVEAVCG